MHRFAWLISYSCKIENNTFNNTFTYIARRSKGPLCVFNCKIPDISYHHASIAIITLLFAPGRGLRATYNMSSTSLYDVYSFHLVVELV